MCSSLKCMDETGGFLLGNPRYIHVFYGWKTGRPQGGACPLILGFPGLVVSIAWAGLGLVVGALNPVPLPSQPSFIGEVDGGGFPCSGFHVLEVGRGGLEQYSGIDHSSSYLEEGGSMFDTCFLGDLAPCIFEYQTALACFLEDDDTGSSAVLGGE